MRDAHARERARDGASGESSAWARGTLVRLMTHKSMLETSDDVDDKREMQIRFLRFKRAGERGRACGACGRSELASELE